MAKAKVIKEVNGTPIVTDGNLYYIPDGLGDFLFFGNLSAAEHYATTGEYFYTV